MLPREVPTLTQSRRRMNLNVLPSLTDKMLNIVWMNNRWVKNWHKNKTIVIEVRKKNQHGYATERSPSHTISCCGWKVSFSKMSHHISLELLYLLKSESPFFTSMAMWKYLKYFSDKFLANLQNKLCSKIVLNVKTKTTICVLT